MIRKHNWFSDAIRADMERKAARGEVKLVEDAYDQWRRSVIMASAKPAGRRAPRRARPWNKPHNGQKEGGNA